MKCAECGGRITRRPRPDALREYRRGVRAPYPAEFAVPSCEGCGEIYLNAALSVAVDAAILARESARTEDDHAEA